MCVLPTTARCTDSWRHRRLGAVDDELRRGRLETALAVVAVHQPQRRPASGNGADGDGSRHHLHDRRCRARRRRTAAACRVARLRHRRRAVSGTAESHDASVAGNRHPTGAVCRAQRCRGRPDHVRTRRCRHRSHDGVCRRQSRTALSRRLRRRWPSSPPSPAGTALRVPASAMDGDALQRCLPGGVRRRRRAQRRAGSRGGARRLRARLRARRPRRFRVVFELFGALDRHRPTGRRELLDRPRRGGRTGVHAGSREPRTRGHDLHRRRATPARRQRHRHRHRTGAGRQRNGGRAGGSHVDPHHLGHAVAHRREPPSRHVPVH